MSSGASLDLGTKIVKKNCTPGEWLEPTWKSTSWVWLPLHPGSSPLGWKARRQKPIAIFLCNHFQGHNYESIEWKLTVQIPQGRGHTCCQFEPEGWIVVEVMAFFWAKSRIFAKRIFGRTDWAAFCCQRRVERPRKPPWWSKCHT